MTEKFELVEALNKLVSEAIKHGGDAGGSYDSNKEGLEEAINNLLKMLYLSDDYKVDFDKADTYDGIKPKWPVNTIFK